MRDLSTIIRDANDRVVVDGNVEAIDTYFDKKYVVNFGGDKKSGHAGVRGFTKTIHNAFSELSVDVEILVESGERISWQRCITGVQTGPFHGFPASGRSISWRDMVVSKIVNDKIAEEWVVTDLAEALLRARK